MANNNLSSALQMTIEEISPCQKKFEFAAAKETVANEATKVVNHIAGMATIPGFRKGKAPAKMIISKYGNDVKDELKRRIFGAAFEKVSADEALDIVSYGMPKEEQELELDAEFKFALNFDLAPEIELPEYKGVKVEVAPAEVSKEMIQERLDYYKNMYAAYEDIDTPAEKEDMLKVSYTSDFELAEDASASLKRQVSSESNWLWLNSPEMIPGSIDALTGAEKDKEYSFEADYPADWRDEELAGKKVKYNVKVLNVQRRKALADDQLAEKMQMESMDKLWETLKQGLEHEAQGKQRNEISEAVYKKVSDGIADFDLPPSILESEVEKELRRVAQTAVKSEEEAESFKKDIEKHRKEAEQAAKDKLRRLFICRKIAKLENIEVEQHELDGQIKAMGRYYGYKEKELRSMLEKSGGMEDVRLDLLAAKVSGFLAEKAEVSDAKPVEKSSAKKEK